ncbi:MAG: hypothetical protein IT287_02930 [Bdellovibrionaceae bacterium]|nr:hypothetical protein [Pseudobdellovibrionaceae bacterium]
MSELIQHSLPLAHLGEADVTALKKHLEYDVRWRPMYTDAFHNFYKELHAEPYVSVKALRTDFLYTFHNWVTGSRLNTITGLDAYVDRDVILGVTHSIDDLHFTHKEQIVVLDNEYTYHQKINPLVKTKQLSEITAQDVLIVSYPFSDTGRMPHGFSQIIARAERVGFPVHVDCAWYGCSRGLDMDFSSAAIKSISFSLSKALGMGKHRIGVRYTRKRPSGPVSVCNDYGYLHDSLMWLAIKFINRFGPDYLQDQFYSTYRAVCEKWGLIETNTIYLAEDLSADVKKRVGLRSVLRWLHEGRL